MKRLHGESISSKVKLLVITDPGEAKNPVASERALKEVAVMMNKEWELHLICSSIIHYKDLPCRYVVHKAGWEAYRDSIILKSIYILLSIFKGIRIVGRYNIHLILTISGHIHLGLVAHLVGRLTKRKTLIRVDSDIISDSIFFIERLRLPIPKRELFQKIHRKLLEILERYVFKHVDWIVTHGPMDYETIRTITKSVSFIPLWVDVKKFAPHPDYRERLKKELVGDTKTKVVLYVGRLHPEKNVETLIYAFKMVSDRLNHVLLLIVGQGPQEDDLKALASELDIQDKVNFCGYVNNDYIPKYYQASDVYVLSSFREEWSNTIMEAMASGVPVIASNVPSNFYLIKDHETGFLVPSKDPTQLAERILYILENRGNIKGIVLKARNYVKRYDKFRIGSLYKKVILNLIKGKIPPSETILTDTKSCRSWL